MRNRAGAVFLTLTIFFGQYGQTAVGSGPVERTKSLSAEFAQQAVPPRVLMMAACPFRASFQLRAAIAALLFGMTAHVVLQRPLDAAALTVKEGVLLQTRRSNPKKTAPTPAPNPFNVLTDALLHVKEAQDNEQKLEAQLFQEFNAAAGPIDELASYPTAYKLLFNIWVRSLLNAPATSSEPDLWQKIRAAHRVSQDSLQTADKAFATAQNAFDHLNRKAKDFKKIEETDKSALAAAKATLDALRAAIDGPHVELNKPAVFLSSQVIYFAGTLHSDGTIELRIYRALGITDDTQNALVLAQWSRDIGLFERTTSHSRAPAFPLSLQTIKENPSAHLIALFPSRTAMTAYVQGGQFNIGNFVGSLFHDPAAGITPPELAKNPNPILRPSNPSTSENALFPWYVVTTSDALTKSVKAHYAQLNLKLPLDADFDAHVKVLQDVLELLSYITDVKADDYPTLRLPVRDAALQTAEKILAQPGITSTQALEKINALHRDDLRNAIKRQAGNTLSGAAKMILDGVAMNRTSDGFVLRFSGMTLLPAFVLLPSMPLWASVMSLSLFGIFALANVFQRELKSFGSFAGPLYRQRLLALRIRAPLMAA